MSDNMVQLDLADVRGSPIRVSAFKCPEVAATGTRGVIAYCPYQSAYVYLSNDRAYNGGASPAVYGMESYGYAYAWSGGSNPKNWRYTPSATEQKPDKKVDALVPVADISAGQRIKTARFEAINMPIDEGNGLITRTPTGFRAYLSNNIAYKGASAPSSYQLDTYGFKYAWTTYSADSSWKYTPMLEPEWAFGEPITQKILASGVVDKYLPLHVRNVLIAPCTITEGVIAKLNKSEYSPVGGKEYFLLHNSDKALGITPAHDDDYGKVVSAEGTEFAYSWILSGTDVDDSLEAAVTTYTGINYKYPSAVEAKCIKAREVEHIDVNLVIDEKGEWETMNKTYSIKVLVEKLTAAKDVQAAAIKAAGVAGLKAAQDQMNEFIRTGKASILKYPVINTANPVEAYDNALQELSLLAGEEVQAQDLGFDPIRLIRNAGDVTSKDRYVQIRFDD